jgi:exodeoxyribonuclease V gamma subunit
MQKTVLSMSKAFLSNRSDELYEHLKNELYSIEADPFCKRLVIIPSLSLKSYLLSQLASSSAGKISFGLKILSLKSSIDKLLSLVLARHLVIPSVIDWQVAITDALKKLILSQDESDLQKLVLTCLQIDFPVVSLSLIHEKKIEEFSQRISIVFDDWAWEGKKGENKGSKNFNTPYYTFLESFWDYLTEQKLLWDLPYRHLTEIVEQKQSIDSKLFYKEIHLFGFSSIPANFYRFFQALSLKISVNFYILSPCMMFWTDILSDAEAHRLGKKIEKQKISLNKQVALDEFLFERNSLLANVGKVGRDFIQLIENCSDLHEVYRVNPAVFHTKELADSVRFDALSNREDTVAKDSPLTLLEGMQTDLLLLTGRRKEKMNICDEDRTIQLHSTQTEIREIEELYSSLLKLSQNLVLKAADIIVLAPNINMYTPYIERVFGKKSSLFAYQVFDSGKEKKPHSLFAAFLELLTLSEKRFSNEAIIQLFQCQAFRKKAELELDDLLILSYFFHESGFRQALDPSHYQEILVKEGYNAPSLEWSSTFKEVEDFLLPAWIGNANEKESIDSSQAKAIARAIFTIRELYQMHQKIRVQTELPIRAWVEHFETLLSAYFQIDFQDAEEKAEFEFLTSAFAKFAKLEKLNNEAKLSLSSAQVILEMILNETSKSSDTFLQKEVVFASLGTMRAHPAQIVCLIGMNEKAFPRKAILPQAQDIDRYLFLEALLSARNTLYISYQGFSFEDRLQLQPAVPVQDLLQTLDEGYLIDGMLPSKKLIERHALMPDEATYENKRCDFFTIQKGMKELKQTVDVKYLSQVARNPLKAYLESDHNLRLLHFKDQLCQDLEFESSDVYDLLRKAAFLSEEEYEYALQNHPKIPDGIVKKAALNLFRKERQEILFKKEKLGLQMSKPFTIELNVGAKSFEKIAPHHFVFPAIKLEIENKQVLIQGKLDKLYQEGFLLYEKQELSKVIGAWPEFLIYSHLANCTDHFQAKGVYFLKDAKVKSLKIDNPLHELQKFTTHALNTGVESYALYPEWIEDIIQKEREPFHAQLQENSAKDRYLNFFMKRTSPQLIDSLFSDLKKRAQFLYGDLIKNWEQQ